MKMNEVLSLLKIIKKNIDEAQKIAIKDFAKKMIDAVDESTIVYSSDIVDFTAEYLEELRKL